MDGARRVESMRSTPACRSWSEWAMRAANSSFEAGYGESWKERFAFIEATLMVMRRREVQVEKDRTHHTPFALLIPQQKGQGQAVEP